MLTAAWATRKLEYQIGRTQPEDLVLRLFVNDHQPHPRDSAEVYADPSDGGYSPVRLKPGDWNMEAASPGRAPIATYPEIQWTFAGGKFMVYGYFITGLETNILVGGERFAQPRPVEFLGDIEKVIAVLVGGL